MSRANSASSSNKAREIISYDPATGEEIGRAPLSLT